MTNQEFSNQFQVLVNSYRRFRDFDNKEPLDTLEFDEYEKSLYLTKAQEELVISLYNGKNVAGDSFEQTEEVRRYLATLIKSVEISPIQNTSGILGIDSNSKFFTLPNDLWFITYESVNISDGNCEGHTSLDVYPARQDEYAKLRKNPFRGANSRRALRFDLSDDNIEIVSKYTVTKYYVRYMRKLNPIILETMPNGITIGNTSIETSCELPETLHQKILERAVLTALRTRGMKIENNENR